MFFFCDMSSLAMSRYGGPLTTTSLLFPQAAGAERAAPPAERGAEGPAAAEQQAAAAERADLPTL